MLGVTREGGDLVAWSSYHKRVLVLRSGCDGVQNKFLGAPHYAKFRGLLDSARHGPEGATEAEHVATIFQLSTCGLKRLGVLADLGMLFLFPDRHHLSTE